MICATPESVVVEPTVTELPSQLIPLPLFGQKACRDCGQSKALADFNRHPKTRDRRQQRCRDCFKELLRQWWRANGDRARLSAAARREATREHIRHRDRRRYHSEYQDNPQKYLSRVHKRRALKLGNGGDYSPEEWRLLCEHFQNICLACHQSRRLTADHVVPLSLGGKNDIGNIQPLCRTCNARKHNRIIDYRPFPAAR